MLCMMTLREKNRFDFKDFSIFSCKKLSSKIVFILKMKQKKCKRMKPSTYMYKRQVKNKSFFFMSKSGGRQWGKRRKEPE